jgi:hypothetical protein
METNEAKPYPAYVRACYVCETPDEQNDFTREDGHVFCSPECLKEYQEH